MRLQCHFSTGGKKRLILFPFPLKNFKLVSTIKNNFSYESACIFCTIKIETQEKVIFSYNDFIFDETICSNKQGVMI